MSEPARYAVMGNPIGHSRSPHIHAEFARQCAQHMEYQAILVEPGGLSVAVNEFLFQHNGQGLNITVPFKQEAFALAEVRTERALRAKAVNTLLKTSEGRLLGDNTDGVGLLRDLQRLGVEIAGKRILLLGAGGAARGVLAALLEQEPALLLLANRSADKARALREEEPEYSAFLWSDYGHLGGSYDVLINATSASLHGEVPQLPHGLLAEGAVAYDMVYAARPTAFLEWAMTEGCTRCADGLGMLVEQAAESFYRWRQCRPDTQPVLRLLRHALSLNAATH